MAEKIFSQEVIDTYRGWDALVGNKDYPGFLEEGVVDIDVAPRANPLIFADQEEVHSQLKRLIRELPENEQDRELLDRKLKASLMFSRVLMGEQVEITEYVENTIGIKLRPIPESEIEDSAASIDSMLRERGLRHDPQHKDAYTQKFVITDREKIKKAIVGGIEWVKTATSRNLGKVDNEVEPELVEIDASWIAWLSTDAEGEPFLKINKHPRHTFTYGKIAALAVHEFGGHALQLSKWKNAVRQGWMNPALGLTTNHSPEVVQFEAVAQIMEQLLLPEHSWEAGFEAKYYEYKGKIYHNAHLEINKSGASDEEVLGYMKERLPLEPLENMKKSIIARRDNPTLRTYFASYEPSLDLVRPVLKMNTDQQRIVLARLYGWPMTPKQIKELVKQSTAR